MRFALPRGPESLSVTIKQKTLAVPVKRHERARRLILRVDAATGGPVVTLPRRTSLHEAQLFLDRHVDWLERRLTGSAQPNPFQDGAVIPLRGARCRIVAGGGRGLVRLLPGPEMSELHVPGAAEHVARRVRNWLKAEAKRDLAKAVEHFSGLLGKRPSAIRLGDAQTRWGSCASSGRLAFSWRLILAPPEVLRYVAAHEVAHLQEMNHGRGFWAVVRRLDPDFQASRAWLKAHGPALQAVGRAGRPD